MRPPRLPKLGSLAVVLLSLVVLGACTDTVFRDRPPFNPPPDAASGFLGYYTEATNQTTCGNCHIGQQADWNQTHHSEAWDILQADPNAQEFCQSCHTVNSRGNQPTAAVGYDAVKSTAYQDVQCESCHGPGFTHVQNPTIDANKPLAHAQVYPTSAVADTAAVVNSSCAGCHQGAGPSQNHNYLKEWRASRHGQLRQSQAANASCAPCHEGKGALAAWGINTVYQEKGTTTLLPQNCVVCHDPHGTAKDDAGQPLEGQLRYPIDSPDITQNLCTKCHGRVDRSVPNPTSSRGPHGSQGSVLFGEAGYFPPGSTYDTLIIFATHGSTGNPRLCAGCHVNTLTGLDAGGTSVSFSGHTFHPLPCLQQKAPEVVDTTFINSCAYDVPSRSWQACTNSGCHIGGEAVAQSLFTGIRTEVDGYAKTLWIDVDGDQTLDAFPTDSGYLPKILASVPGDLDYTGPNKDLLTAAKGAVFNVQMLGEGYAGHPDGSKGVHNPFLYRALLQASIADLVATYPGVVPAPPAPVIAAIQSAVQRGQLRLSPKLERAVMTASRR